MIRQMGIAMAIVTALVAPALAQDRLDPVQTREELVAAQMAALRVLKEARIYLEQRRAQEEQRWATQQVAVEPIKKEPR